MKLSPLERKSLELQKKMLGFRLGVFEFTIKITNFDKHIEIVSKSLIESGSVLEYYSSIEAFVIVEKIEEHYVVLASKKEKDKFLNKDSINVVANVLEVLEILKPYIWDEVVYNQNHKDEKGGKEKCQQ